MVKANKRSPEPLLQELLWPDRWKCTMACLMLNQTTRVQVDKVWPTLFAEAPTPKALLDMPIERLQEIIKPLGLWRVRSKRMRQLAEAWGTVPHHKLPGVGIYANQSDRIFFGDDLLLNETVNDGALTKYLRWRRCQNFFLNRDINC
jgi:endonuclease III